MKAQIADLLEIPSRTMTKGENKSEENNVPMGAMMNTNEQ